LAQTVGIEGGAEGRGAGEGLDEDSRKRNGDFHIMNRLGQTRVKVSGMKR